jgi:hypothetical protein
LVQTKIIAGRWKKLNLTAAISSEQLQRSL